MTYEISHVVRPGGRCPHCRVCLPPTALEYWMAIQDETYTTLAVWLGTTKNLVWRLNHQAPGYRSRRWQAREIQGQLLQLTGLSIRDLQNERPSGGYACGDEPSDIPRQVWVRRNRKKS